MRTLLRTRLLRGLFVVALICGFTLITVGCAQNTTTPAKQVDQSKCLAKCPGKCDPAKCPHHTAAAKGDSANCPHHKDVAKCPPGCTKPCCAKTCPKDAQKAATPEAKPAEKAPAAAAKPADQKQ